jgi:hypothetical protein
MIGAAPFLGPRKVTFGACSFVIPTKMVWQLDSKELGRVLDTPPTNPLYKLGTSLLPFIWATRNGPASAATATRDLVAFQRPRAEQRHEGRWVKHEYGTGTADYLFFSCFSDCFIRWSWNTHVVLCAYR